MKISSSKYSGNIASKTLACFDNDDDTIGTYKILMDSLEAGEEAYKEREGIYELRKIDNSKVYFRLSSSDNWKLISDITGNDLRKFIEKMYR